MNLKIDKTIKTPEVLIKSGRIELKGRSIPEDSFAFYIPLLEHITNYLKDPADKTMVIINLEYINSSSKKLLINIFDLLNKKFRRGIPIHIIWQYEEDDEDIFELGKDLKGFYNMPIDLEEIM
jgi:hypothetical protein